MACVAITKGGIGVPYVFQTKEEAFVHPLIQYGDPIFGDPDEVFEAYARFEWAVIMKIAGVEANHILDALDTLTPVEERSARRGMLPRIWDGLFKKAQPLPTDFDALCSLIANDRGQMEKRRMTVEATTGAAMTAEEKAAAKAQAMAEKTKAKAAAAEARAKEKAEKAAAKEAAKASKTSGDGAVKTTVTGGLNPKTVITYAVVNGKPFGADNNPYRPNTGRSDRFLAILDGKTVEENLKVEVLSPGSIKAMAERGHIILTPPAATATADAPTEEAAAAVEEDLDA